MAIRYHRKGENISSNNPSHIDANYNKQRAMIFFSACPLFISSQRVLVHFEIGSTRISGKWWMIVIGVTGESASTFRHSTKCDAVMRPLLPSNYPRFSDPSKLQSKYFGRVQDCQDFSHSHTCSVFPRFAFPFPIHLCNGSRWFSYTCAISLLFTPHLFPAPKMAQQRKARRVVQSTSFFSIWLLHSAPVISLMVRPQILNSSK